MTFLSSSNFDYIRSFQFLILLMYDGYGLFSRSWIVVWTLAKKFNELFFDFGRSYLLVA